MNTPEFPVAREGDSLGKDREGGGGMLVRMFTIEGRREQLDEFAPVSGKRSCCPHSGIWTVSECCWSLPGTGTARYW